MGDFTLELGEAWRFAFEQHSKIRGREPQADEKATEKTVDRAGFIEAHLIDEFLEDQGIVREEIDAPLPIVETDGTGDDLDHAPRVPAADPTVLAHHPLSFDSRFALPVLFFGLQ